VIRKISTDWRPAWFGVRGEEGIELLVSCWGINTQVGVGEAL